MSLRPISKNILFDGDHLIILCEHIPGENVDFWVVAGFFQGGKQS